MKKTVFGLIVGLILVNVVSSELTTISTTISESSSLPSSLMLFGAGAKWAAVDGTRALHVSMYDNVVAHPNPIVPDPSIFLERRDSITYALEQYGFNVTVAADIPSDLSGYGVVVIDANWACEPSNEPIIREYLSSGGGVVLRGSAPCYFAYYSKDSNTRTDLSSIVDWFGAQSYSNAGGHACVTVDNPLGTPLLTGYSLVEHHGYSSAAMTSLDSDAQELARWDSGESFVFTHEFSSGRVYYQADIETMSAIAMKGISKLSVEPKPDDSIDVSATFTDSNDVSEAFVSYTSESSWHSVSMNRIDNVFHATIPPRSRGPLQYKIYASETNGKWAVSPTYSFAIDIAGDVDGNGIVNMLDLYKIALSFGAGRNDPNYLANCDIDKNGIINMLDLYIAAVHFG